MSVFNKPNRKTVGDVRATSGKGCVIWIVGFVVLSVSLLSCVTYIGLMGKVFPDGIFRVLCYVGAFANFILMCALLWGKFVWFRPGLHEYASWGVNFLEIVVCILNLVLAFQLSTEPNPLHLGTMYYWYLIAPITPVFSMVGAIILILTSDDLKRKHKDMQVEEEKAEAQQELDLEQHRATIDVQRSYTSQLSSALSQHLISPQAQRLISQHGDMLLTKIISDVSGMPVTSFTTPQIVEADRVKLAQVAAPTKKPESEPQVAGFDMLPNKTVRRTPPRMHRRKPAFMPSTPQGGAASTNPLPQNPAPKPLPKQRRKTK